MRLLTTALVLIASMAIAGMASAQERFKAITTFTVIADMARNVASGSRVCTRTAAAGVRRLTMVAARPGQRLTKPAGAE